MLQLLVVHLVAAMVAPGLVRAIGSRAMLLLALAPASAAVWAFAQTSTVADGRAVEQSSAWIHTLGLDLDFRMATLSWVMVLLVSGVGALVLAYCAFYFGDGERGLGQFGAVFVAFAGAMFGLVVADDLLLLYVFWELTTVTSYLLIGHNPERGVNRRAAMQALLVTTLGGLAMLVGLIIIGQTAGTYTISEILADPPSGSLVTAALVLVLIGALSKSALIPFHFWLPSAMAAPTPVSAYLHAAAMVKAGVYLLALLAPTFAATVPWRAIVIPLGLATMILGGFTALRQTDLKLLVAYGTVSQLGFLAVVLGIGTRAAALAGLAMLVAHSLFKAGLFLVVGIIDKATGTRELPELSGLRHQMPGVFWIALVSAASMAGLPPLVGFAAKEAVLEAFLPAMIEHDTGIGALGAWLELAGIVVGTALTVAYSIRFVWGAFADKPGMAATEAKAVSTWFPVWPAILAAGGVVLGVWSRAAEVFVEPYAAEFPPGEEEIHLGLWHGFTPALGLSVLALAGGAAVFWWRRVLTSRRYLPKLLNAEVLYVASLRGTERVAADVTGATQRGSVPVYLGVILLVAMAVPTVGGLRAGLVDQSWPDQFRWWDSPAQFAVGIVVALAAVFAARSRRRLKAVILVGVAGYGAGVLFFLHGAPDLAFTQLLVETVTIIAFVLVLRRMPAYFSDRPLTGERWVRVAIATIVAVVVAGLTFVAGGARIHLPVSEVFPQQAYDVGGGENVVNVVLVDIRAWDTLGEISVLVVAATGIASVIFLRSRRGKLLPSRQLLETARRRSRDRAWLPVGKATDASTRSVIFEVVTRLIFHVIVLYSIYLLFAGHNNPGGGFIGGLVAGLALVVRYLAGGRYELAIAAPVAAGGIVGGGLVIAVGTGLVTMLAGGGMLESFIFEWNVPLFGQVKLVTSLFFDIGVYFVVVGLVLDMLRSLGAEVDRQLEAGSEVESESEVDTENNSVHQDVPARFGGVS
ncbi:MAG TPA: Na+/H+ antiporter subunit A [Jiangellaceae bacterium]